jgi:SAM-dependent methyltransferase
MKRSAPAALRNREPILDVLRELLEPTSRVLELGSGTGQHADFFTGSMPGWTWQPSDMDDANIASIEAYRAESARENFLPARKLDARDPVWPLEGCDAVFSANMIHISPWSVALGLFAGAARILGPQGLFVLYGPFRFSGKFTAASNAAFDARLRGDDPSWGVRDVGDIVRETSALGFADPRIIPMPANNHVLCFARIGP